MADVGGMLGDHTPKQPVTTQGSGVLKAGGQPRGLRNTDSPECQL
jgi:hypothetical protein